MKGNRENTKGAREIEKFSSGIFEIFARLGGGAAKSGFGGPNLGPKSSTSAFRTPPRCAQKVCFYGQPLCGLDR